MEGIRVLPRTPTVRIAKNLDLVSGGGSNPLTYDNTADFRLTSDIDKVAEHMMQCIVANCKCGVTSTNVAHLLRAYT